MLLRVIPILLTLLGVLGCSGGGTELDPPPDSTGTADRDTLVWPISRTPTPDTENLVFPFGPRNIGSASTGRRYDFHGGIDIYAARGTPVGSIMGGTAFVVSESTVMVLHSDNRRTAYLHMDEVRVKNLQVVLAGDVVGTVGDVNSSAVHLHLTYMVGGKRYIDETDAHNPLRILPPDAIHSPTARFVEDSVVVTLHAGTMTVQQIEVEYGDGTGVTLDYTEIVKQGSVARDNQVQSGVHLYAGRVRKTDVGGWEFDLVLSPADTTATIKGVVLRDFTGEVLLEVNR